MRRASDIGKEFVMLAGVHPNEVRGLPGEGDRAAGGGGRSVELGAGIN